MKHLKSGTVAVSNETLVHLPRKKLRTETTRTQPQAAPGPKRNQKNPRCSQEGQCALEEKVVLFVGCTQNGKSSLIRSILRYGGYEEEAAAIRVGLGNSSTTKNVSSHKVVIEVRNHVLRDENGDLVSSIDADTSLYDLEPESSPSQSGQHIHLLMMDTPGLDDSDNAQSDATRKDGNDEHLRIVDEQHKLAVLKALAGVGKVHAVCFVLSIENTLGNSTQALTREYLSIFQHSNLDTSFHFAHTFVNVDNMFHEKAVNRPILIQNTFGLEASRVTHHHINNVAIEDDPIDIHFSNVAIARLLLSLANESGQSTASLRYPKSQAYKSMDYDLTQSINVYQYTLQKQLAPIEAHIARLEQAKKLPVAVKQRQYSTWSDLHDQVTNLDNDNFVDIGYDYKSDPEGNLLQFFIETRFPIREWTVKSIPQAIWDGLNNEVKGTYSCTFTLTKNSEYGIWGSVQLWGWKKEVFGNELKTLQEQKEQAWVEYTKTARQVSSLDSEIEKATANAKVLQDTVRKLQEEKQYLLLDYIPIQRLKVIASYFTTSNILRYSHGLGLERKLSAQLLPITNISLTNLSQECKQKSGDLAELAMICTITLEGIRADVAHKLKIQTDLLRLICKTEEEIERILATVQARWAPRWPTTITTLLEQDRPEAAAPFVELLADLEPRIRRSHDTIAMDLQEEKRRLEERLQSLKPTLDRLDEAIQQSNEKLAKWEAFHLKYTSLLEAMLVLGAVLKSELLTISVFTLLRRGIEECGEDSKEPWDRLNKALLDVYLSDIEGFKDIAWY